MRRPAEWVVSLRYSQGRRRGSAVRIPGPWTPILRVRSLTQESPGKWLRRFITGYQDFALPGAWFKTKGRIRATPVRRRLKVAR
jgi:hypothetical protein